MIAGPALTGVTFFPLPAFPSGLSFFVSLPARLSSYVFSVPAVLSWCLLSVGPSLVSLTLVCTISDIVCLQPDCLTVYQTFFWTSKDLFFKNIFVFCICVKQLRTLNKRRLIRAGERRRCSNEQHEIQMCFWNMKACKPILVAAQNKSIKPQFSICCFKTRDLQQEELRRSLKLFSAVVLITNYLVRPCQKEARTDTWSCLFPT